MSALRILADRNIPAVQDCFGHLGTVRTVEGRGLQAAQLAEVDVLLVRSVSRVDAELLAGTPVRFVGTATAGVDHIDLPWLQRSGIGFAAAPGANANSVVEYVLAAIAAVDNCLERLLAGGRVGIVGCGHVGSLLALRLRALGIASLHCDPWLDQSALAVPASLDEVLACDVLSLHPSLTTAEPWPSHHLLGPEALATLRREQLLINASRGPVLANDVLLARLQQANAPHCVLDVWEFEPQVPPPLLERVQFGTPHIAGYSHDAKLAATRMLAQALEDQLGLESAPVGPGMAVPVFDLPPELAGVELLRHLCGLRYDLAADDRRLREAVLGVAEAEARAAFDRLRREYPLRRELAGSRVRVTNREQEPLVRALGAVVVD
ncbi:4-phosphoerythronate dehydrogenase [Haliea sp. E1-2-M8]|uniref:4-phosphoerythronate dehydrogenase n=1 Tax=Haliea sp. E1-2-M8 TaxID=3064706 RepID=UPI0027164A38|nr:4-phosphoerythronate dehydrogenase [Haliea sp. E1-2-M8]MDO8863895.1 4-phosphoerythronate dehydrogenase [Haliea sp. E1-2-M8]